MATLRAQNRVLQIMGPELAHGVLERAGDEGQPAEWAIYVKPTDPADYVIGLAAPGVGLDELNRFAGELNLYSGLRLFGRHGDRSFLDKRNVLERWRDDGTTKTFLAAARKAQRGVLSIDLAPYLARLRFRPDGAVEVPDFLAMAAWSLHDATMRGGFEVKTCGLCRLPFLASSRATYCTRRAPESREQNCQQVAKVRDFRARKKEKESDG